MSSDLGEASGSSDLLVALDSKLKDTEHVQSWLRPSGTIKNNGQPVVSSKKLLKISPVRPVMCLLLAVLVFYCFYCFVFFYYFLFS